MKPVLPNTTLGWCARAALIVSALWGGNAPAQQPLPPLFPIRSGDLHGLINLEGQVVLPAEYNELRLGQPFIMLRKGYRTAYADADGKLVIEPQDELSQPFAEGLVPMRGKDAAGKPRWGYADARRQLVIAAAFDEAQPFVEGLAVVGIADAWGSVKYGAIDRHGKLVVPAQHDKLLTPGGGLVRAEIRQGPDRSHRVFDARGRDITPAGVDFVGIASDGMVRIWNGRQQGFMSTAGQLVVPPRFAQASDFKEGLARVWVDGKYGYIDKTGTLVIPARYETAEDFSDGLALVKDNGKALFLDRQGKLVLQPEAERVWPFSQGLAVVKVGGKHGYIDKRGRLVIEPQYSFARPFGNGLAFVGQGRMSGYIRPDGRFVWRSEG